MSTSFTVLSQNFSANDVDIMVFETHFLSSPADPFFGGDKKRGYHCVWALDLTLTQMSFEKTS